MPVVASVLPAMRAYLHRNSVDESGNGFVLPELQGSALFADLAESFQHLASLDLELRREDGSVVPTVCIGIQDTHRLVALADEELAVAEEGVGANGPPADGVGEFDQLDGEALSGNEPADDWLEDWTDDFLSGWEPEEPVEFPRYQIHVELLHAEAIP